MAAELGVSPVVVALALLAEQEAARDRFAEAVLKGIPPEARHATAREAGLAQAAS